MHKALFQVKIQLNNFDSFSWNTAFSVNVSKHFIVELSRAFPSKTERSGKSSAARCCMNKHQRSMYMNTRAAGVVRQWVQVYVHTTATF